MHLDESNAGDLLKNLPDEPLRPPSIDIGRAMHEGRRRRLIRRVVLTGGALSLTLLAVAAVPVALAANSGKTNNPAEGAKASPSSSASAAPSPSASASAGASASAAPPPPNVAAPTSCKAEKLPIPDKVAMALVTAADPTGKFIFGRSYPSGGTHQVLLWTNGKATKIPVPGDDPEIHAVNSAGVGVGSSISGEVWSAYVYRNGTVTKLPGENAWANGINAGNTITGVKIDPVSHLRLPVIWRTPTSEPEELTLPAGMRNGEGRDIDDDGTVVGQVFVNGADSGAYAWAPDGTGRALPLPSGKPDTGGSAAYTVRGGWATGIQGGGAGLRWNLRTNQADEQPAFSIRPSTANASGWMVGTDAQGRGLLIAGSKKVQLPDVYLHKPGELTNLPETISDDGRIIAGQADDSGGTIHAALWRCS